MAWTSLLVLGLILWGACGALMGFGRRIWSLDTTLKVHLAVATVVAFGVSAIHKMLAPEFNSLLRAVVLTGLIIALDAALVAPIFERSYAMFRSPIGTWIPFAAIFLASLIAGKLIAA